MLVLDCGEIELLEQRIAEACPENSVAVDSRNVVPGCIFFALPGERTDGHLFLEEAASKGARSAVVRNDYDGDDFGMELVWVEDPLCTLQKAAQKRLKKVNPKVIAITGSVGKTTTKEFLKTILEEKFSLYATEGNQNSQVGLPLCILNNVNDDHEVVILEMGMSEPGNISVLVEIAPPDIAIITSVELVHAANFDSIEEIAMAKAELLRHPKTGVGIIPESSNQFNVLARSGSCMKVPFSLNTEIGEFVENSTALNIREKHFLHNLAAAATAAQVMGMQLEEIEKRLPFLKPPQKRFECVEKKGVTFINDSYNASAVSVKAALDALPVPQKGGRRIAVLGEMLELGQFSKECHEDVGHHALNKVDALYLLGEECRPILDIWNAADKPAMLFEEMQSLLQHVCKDVVPGDVVLVKGSQAKGMWKVIDEFKGI